jgi:hypothetical protein
MHKRKIFGILGDSLPTASQEREIIFDAGYSSSGIVNHPIFNEIIKTLNQIPIRRLPSFGFPGEAFIGYDVENLSQAQNSWRFFIKKSAEHHIYLPQANIITVYDGES